MEIFENDIILTKNNSKREIRSLEFNNRRKGYLLGMNNDSQIVNFPRSSNNIMPSVRKICFLDVPNVAQNPRIFKVQIILIKADYDNIMAIIPVVFVISSRICPGLNFNDDRLIGSDIVFQIRNCQVLLHLCLKSDCFDGCQEILRPSAKVRISLGQLGQVRLAPIGEVVVGQNCQKACRTAGIVCGLHYVWYIQKPYKSRVQNQTQLSSSFQNCRIVESIVLKRADTSISLYFFELIRCRQSQNCTDNQAYKGEGLKDYYHVKTKIIMRRYCVNLE